MVKKQLTVKDIAILAALTTILFVQEQILTFLPNIQLTFFLIILYSIKLGIGKTSIIIFIHTLLDSIFMGAFNIVFYCFMLIGYLIIPITLGTIFKRIRSNYLLAILSILFSLFYSWIYIIPNIFIYHIDVLAYLASDIIFEILLAISSFLSTLWLYNPCSKILDDILKKSEDN